MAVHFIQELPSGSPPGVHGGEDKNDEVSHGHEALCDLLVLVLNGVGAGCIDNVEVLEELTGHADFIDGGGDGCGVHGVPVLEDADLVRGGHDAGLRDISTEERIEEGGLAHIHLTHDDEDKGVVE